MARNLGPRSCERQGGLSRIYRASTPPRCSWLPLWHFLLDSRPNTSPLTICSKSGHTKIVQNILGASTLRTHTLDLLHLLIDKHAKYCSRKFPKKSARSCKKNKIVEISNVFSFFYLEAQNAAAPMFPRSKNQKPAAGGAPIAKYDQNWLFI